MVSCPEISGAKKRTRSRETEKIRKRAFMSKTCFFAINRDITIRVLSAGEFKFRVFNQAAS